MPSKRASKSKLVELVEAVKEESPTYRAKVKQAKIAAEKEKIRAEKIASGEIVVKKLPPPRTWLTAKEIRCKVAAALAMA